MEIVMTIEKAIELLQEDKENYIKASQCGLGYPSDNREHKEKALAIEMILKHLQFYKEGLEREIEKNRENVLEIIDKDHIIDAMAEEIFIKRAYSITCEKDIQRLKEQIIKEYKDKQEVRNVKK